MSPASPAPSAASSRLLGPKSFHWLSSSGDMVHSGIDKNPTKWPSDGGGVFVPRIDCHCISSSYWPPEEAKGKQVKGQYMPFQNT